MTMTSKPSAYVSGRHAPQWFYAPAGILVPMWEGSGNPGDLGSIAGGFTLAGAAPPTWGTDALGTCLTFGSVSAYCPMGTPSGFGTLMANGPFTAFAVVRPNAMGALACVIQDGSSGKVNRSIEFRKTSTDCWQAFVGASGTITVVGGTGGGVVAVSGALTVLVLTFDTTDANHHTATLYVDGTYAPATTDFGTKTLDNGVALTIGRDGAADDGHFSGNILMVGAQPVVWSAAQIAQFSADPLSFLVNPGVLRHPGMDGMASLMGGGLAA